MKIVRLFLVIIALLFVLEMPLLSQAETSSDINQTAISLDASQPLDGSVDNSQKIIDEFYSSPMFKPYSLSKHEVQFSYTKNLINAIDPTPSTNRSASYLPGTRGTNQLVIYTPFYGVRTNTNEFGAEAIVEGNTVTELSGADSPIPANGIVISGHGRAKNWINNSIKVGTKIYIDRSTNLIYTYTTSESYIFESQKKIREAEQMIAYYREHYDEYNWKVPTSYIDDAKEYLKKAQRNPENVQKYSRLAIEAANDALKSVIPYKYGELKGVWLRPTEKTSAEIVDTIQRVKNTGIDTIFLETYFHGKTIYPSQVMKDYGFLEQHDQFKGFDPLSVWLKEAHKRNIKVHVWFETFYAGNANINNNPQSMLAINPEWGNKMGKDKDSLLPSRSPSEHNGYFLDPANPLVQDFIMKLITEVSTKYDIDGINLDYIRYPQTVSITENNSWGYTGYARREFKALYGVDPADIKVSDPLWLTWCNYRRGKITQMVKKIGTYGKQHNIYVSAVIFPDRLTAMNTKLQDWKTWSDNNYINAFTPLFLTCDSKMANSMMKEVLQAMSKKTDLYAGLFVTFMGGAEEDLIRQIHEARKVDTKGVIIFDYAHLNNKYAKTLATSVFSTKSAAKKIDPQSQGVTVVIKEKPKKKKKGFLWWGKK